MDSYQVTSQTWDKIAALYQEKFMDLDLYHDTYDRFCEIVDKRDPSILEIGCGPGNMTKYLLGKRPDFEIEAIDVAPNMIELAQANNPGVHFHVLDCRDLDKLRSKYDAVVAGFCMPYLSREDSVKFLRDCAGLLRNGGILYLSTIRGDYTNSGYVAASTGDKCYVYYYAEDFLRQEFIKNNFTVLELSHKQFQKEDGTISDDIVFIAKKS
jgi:2-polyprenyl-3-methyl-5-hydroxy-6-metoxy-1,4-benzoquinol methylase